MYNVKDITTAYRDSLESPGQTKLGFHGGAGVDVRLLGLSIFVEASVRYVLTDGRGRNTSRGSTWYFPIDIDGRF